MMDGKERMTQLREWLEGNGGYLQETIDMAYHEEEGYHLRALRPIDSNKALVHVPRSLVLSVSTLSFAKSCWPEQFIEDYSSKPYVITRFLLMDEYLHGRDSWWYPYIALLPQPEYNTQSPPFNTPLWFSEEDMRWLHGTGLQKATKQMSDLWQAEYSSGVKYLSQLPNYSQFTWSLYLWAATAISSRCFPNDKYTTQQNSSLPANDGKEQIVKEKADRHPVLVPVLDLANHDPKVNMECSINQNGYSLFLTTKVLQAEQIYITYGDKSNEELLMGYGFVIPDNPSDILGLSFPILDTPRKLCMEQAITEGKRFPLFVNDSRHSLKESAEAGSSRADDIFYLKIGTLPPASLLDTIRLNISNERELKDFYNEKDQSTKRSFVQAYSQLVLALLHRMTLLSASPAALNQVASTTNQLVARMYALGQQQILVYHVQKLLRDLIRVRHSPTVWSLRDLLSSSSSHPIKTGMRKLCRAVCATRNHVKLKSQGFEDSIMIIFICLLWLTTPRDQQALEQSDAAEETETYGLFHRWCSFLDSTYCPPPGRDIPCIGINCLCSTRSSCPWTLSELEDGNSATIDAATSAHAIVHRAFLLDEVDPLFGKVENWTEEFLQWGCGVWMAEAVLLPVPPDDSEDYTLDVHSLDNIEMEKVLYLEMLSSNVTTIDS